MNTGIKLKLLREKRKLSQEELADKLVLAQTTVSNWEKGNSIKHHDLKKLSDYFDIPLEYLVEEKQLNIVHQHGEYNNLTNSFEITIKFNK